MSFLQKLQKTALQEAPAKFQGAKLQKSSGGFQKNGAKLIQHLYFWQNALVENLKSGYWKDETLTKPISPNTK